MIPLLRLLLLKLRKRPQQEPYMRIILQANKHPLLTDAPASRSTPLGHVPYRQVNTQVSLDEGVERARKRRYYRPEVHDE